MYNETMSEYIEQKWNIIDLTGSICMIAYCILHPKYKDVGFHTKERDMMTTFLLVGTFTYALKCVL